ncbi:MAG: hypothetical protein RLY14_390 [Planctomycetota bacterium]|jgi:hypothetical protein
MHRLLLIAMVALLIGIVTTSPSAQEPAAAASSTTNNASNLVATLTEYRFKTQINPKIEVTELLKQTEELQKQGSLESIETLRVSFREGTEFTFQHGKQVPFVTGTNVSGSGRTLQNIQMREVGLILKLLATKAEGKINVDLEYDAARLVESKDELPAMVSKMRVSAKLLLEAKTPVIVSNTSGDRSTILLLQID